MDEPVEQIGRLSYTVIRSDSALAYQNAVDEGFCAHPGCAMMWTQLECYNTVRGSP
jgi:hypothetical protein